MICALLQSNCLRWFNCRKFSDVVLISGHLRIYCHKLVLCGASAYFQPLLDPDRRFLDGQQGIIELREDSPGAVYAMVRYIYTSEYTVKDTPRAHLELLKAARKYLIPTLPDKALEEFRSSSTRFQDRCVEENNGLGLFGLMEDIANSRVGTVVVFLCF
jgi:hypothetical protein